MNKLRAVPAERWPESKPELRRQGSLLSAYTGATFIGTYEMNI
ncbi:MAG: hypothetical protein ACE1ZA_22470 [Pseudomonadales bacterium]